MPRVSVVIPVRDDAPFLRSCLESLARQTIRPFEIVVVDNGSSDESAEVAHRHGARVVVEPRTGIAVAAARGYDEATGDIIARLDADSVAPVDWLRMLGVAFRDHPDVDAVTGSAHFTDGPLLWRRVAARLYLGAYFAAASTALGHVPVFGSNFAMRREAWSDVRGEAHTLDTRLHDDFDLSFHLGRAHRIRYLRELRLGISMRPLLDGGTLLRAIRGFRSVTVHWPHDLPWLRIGRRLVLRRRRRTVSAQPRRAS